MSIGAYAAVPFGLGFGLPSTNIVDIRKDAWGLALELTIQHKQNTADVFVLYDTLLSLANFPIAIQTLAILSTLTISTLHLVSLKYTLN